MAGTRAKSPLVPSNVTEVVQFSKSMLFTDLKFLPVMTINVGYPRLR